MTLSTKNNPDLAIRLPDPIFVLGITKRSGTNYLRDLLYFHPDCALTGPIWEHYYMEHAEMLTLYSQFTYNRWIADRQADEIIGPDFLNQHLGQGLISFLNSQLLHHGKTVMYDPQHLPLSPTLRLVTKSPSVENIQYFFRLLPNIKLLIIIRDGRAVTESSVKTFGKSYEVAMREWEDAAQTIIRFQAQMQGTAHQYKIIKYEDLYQNSQQTMTDIFRFLDMDVSRYPFEKIKQMSIRGSSELSQQGEVHWRAVKKSKDFNPLQRWQKWDSQLHARFNWVAGEAQEKLGYDRTPLTNVNRGWMMARNMLLDLFWKPIWPIRQKMRKLKYMLGV